jgi:23S rRNA pseudouridine1911/1915/1917 synthase
VGLFPKDRNLALAPDRVEIEVRASDFRASPADFEMRLDAFLCHHLRWRSRTSIQRLIDQRYVLVERRPPELGGALTPVREARRAAERLRHGERVTVVIPAEHRLDPLADAPGALAILYEDESTLVLDKPAGLSVHPGGRHLTDSLIQRVHARYRTDSLIQRVHARYRSGEPAGDPARDTREPIPIRLCHRLDRETSGVVLFGKGDLAHRRLRKQFERREVEKDYLAVVRGEPASEGGRIELPLGPARASTVRLKITVREDGAPSLTEWRVLERRRGYALVLCSPRTGRQHQIRVHLAAIGLPIVGDKLYGGAEDIFLRHTRGELSGADLAELELPRQALHSHRIAWRDPFDLAPRQVTSPLAADLRAYLDRAESVP